MRSRAEYSGYSRGTDVPDIQTGLRGWPVAACRDSLRIAINGYDFELECLLRAHRWNQDGIRHVPISTIYTDDNRSSHFRPIRDPLGSIGFFSATAPRRRGRADQTLSRASGKPACRAQFAQQKNLPRLRPHDR